MKKKVLSYSSSLAGIILCLPVIAHEYWLEPLDSFSASNVIIVAHIKVGQHFKGNNYPYLPTEVESIQLHLGDETVPLSPRFGSNPAILQQSLGDGLNILSVETYPYKINYDSSEKFEKFVREEGIDWVLGEHEKRQLPSTGFVEAYRRHTKMLVKVGDGRGKDRRVGMEFEWVLQSSPYAEVDDELVAQLWWRGEVFPNSQARLFVKRGDEVTEKVLRTDADGLVRFPRAAKSQYLVNAVHMLLPDDETAQDTGAVWESRWASLTFATSDD